MLIICIILHGSLSMLDNSDQNILSKAATFVDIMKIF